MSTQAGDVFELDGVWYVVVDNGKRLPPRPEKISPQPTSGISDEYIHEDGTTHICANLKCPNLVPRSKNSGKPRIYCDRRCALLVVGRRHDAKRGSGRDYKYDVLHRLYAVVIRRLQSKKASRERFLEHLDGLKDRCPEANEASNFKCPGQFNPNCYSKATWERYHQGGPWPGACLIYATLKDHYKTMYYAEAGQDIDRDYTVGRGEYWRWRSEIESDMLPLPEGILRQ